MSNLFYCTGCSRYLNTKYYNRECSSLHTAPDSLSAAHKCKHGGIFYNCRVCNPYTCECGRLISNNPHCIRNHLLTLYHKRHTTISPKVSAELYIEQLKNI